MTTHMVLVRAKEYLLNHGWHQGDFGPDWQCGPRCVAGAIKESGGQTRGEPWNKMTFAAFRAVRDVVGESPADWNDAPDRTLDEVIAALDAAILATAPPREDSPIFTALEDLPAEQYIEALSVLALIPAEAIGA